MASSYLSNLVAVDHTVERKINKSKQEKSAIHRHLFILLLPLVPLRFAQSVAAMTVNIFIF